MDQQLTEPGPITVMVVDDHPVVRNGVRLVLEAEADIVVVGETGNSIEVEELALKLMPRVLVLDMMMPGLGGLETTLMIRRNVPATGVVILSMHSEMLFVAQALANGALGYVLKESNSSELLAAVRCAAAGNRYVSPAIGELLIAALATTAGKAPLDYFESLTNRERQVLQLVAEGFDNRKISVKLNISPRSVETHRTRFMAKLGLSNPIELVRYAIKLGLISV